MTAYRNFVSDFPERCRQILDSYEKSAKLSGREVSLSLAIASAALVVPFERLCPSAEDHVAPDRTGQRVTELGRLLNKPFLEWVASNSWLQIQATPAHTIKGRNVEEWLTFDATCSLFDDRTVGSVLSVLRNSLAHGNLYSRAGNGNTIRELIFLSKRREDRPAELCPTCGRRTPRLIDEYEGIIATPRDFVGLLRTWIGFLTDLRLPEDLVQEKYLDLLGETTRGVRVHS